jgi:hypothetical protein
VADTRNFNNEPSGSLICGEHRSGDDVYKIKWYSFSYAAFHPVSCDLVTNIPINHKNVCVDK